MSENDSIKDVCVYFGEALADYGFGHGHPLGRNRIFAFWDAMHTQALDGQVRVVEPVQAGQEIIERFHSHDYVEFVKAQSALGDGFLDYGDTPSFEGVYKAAATVVGCVVDGLAHIMEGDCRRVFVPIAGLHHARRDGAAGFCVFNDCGVAIETLRHVFGIKRVAYVDIDAHHGDGVYYGFEDDPDVWIADIHEDGRYLYPGTGARSETGRGRAKGTKLNIPLPPQSGDDAFMEVWPTLEAFVEEASPEFILLQCGADSLDGDPLTHLRYSPRVHGYAAQRLRCVADKVCRGRVLATGGGGYDLRNVAAAWTAVVKAFL